MRGTIDVQSTLGRGTSFGIRLPVARAEEASPARANGGMPAEERLRDVVNSGAR
jgi:hypothetical protein